MQTFNLVSVIGVYRHGDRCCKQKAKIQVETECVFDFLVGFYKLNPNDPQDVNISFDKTKEIETLIVHFGEFLAKNKQQIKEIDKLKELF